MFRKAIALAALAFTSAIPSLASARTDVPVPAACVVRGHQVDSVKPYTKEVRFGRVSYPRVFGGTAHLKAEPGLSAQWLRVDLGQRMADCGLNRDRVRVEVETAPAGYNVNFVSREPNGGRSVLEQVQAALPGPLPSD